MTRLGSWWHPVRAYSCEWKKPVWLSLLPSGLLLPPRPLNTFNHGHTMEERPGWEKTKQESEGTFVWDQMIQEEASARSCICRRKLRSSYWCLWFRGWGRTVLIEVPRTGLKDSPPAPSQWHRRSEGGQCLRPPGSLRPFPSPQDNAFLPGPFRFPSFTPSRLWCHQVSVFLGIFLKRFYAKFSFVTQIFAFFL